MARVFVKFPKTGLGNMMLVWAKAIVFAKINKLDYATSSWWGFRWGAILRREKKNRLYRNYFVETPLFKREQYALQSITMPVVKEPKIEVLSEEERSSNKIFLFQKVVTDRDLFGSLRNHRAFIKEELNKILHRERKEELLKYPAPVIGVHIRRGDFKLGKQTTPLNHFIAAIKTIRNASGKVLPVTVFTDANPDELQGLLEMPRISIAEGKADIADILVLSKSRILILSRSSTFSYWAAFLSDSPVVIHNEDWQNQIRESNDFAEIRYSETDSQLTRALETYIHSVKHQFEY